MLTNENGGKHFCKIQSTKDWKEAWQQWSNGDVQRNIKPLREWEKNDLHKSQISTYSRRKTLGKWIDNHYQGSVDEILIQVENEFKTENPLMNLKKLIQQIQKREDAENQACGKRYEREKNP
jgi:hypothetical protein